MSDVADARFAPPQAHVADLAQGEAVLAGRGIRLLAAVIDVIVLAGAWWVVLNIPMLGSAVETESSLSGSIAPRSFCLELGIFLLAQGWLLVTRGQTIGKLLCRLRIVRSDGSRPDAWRLLGLRYGISLVTNLHVLVH